MNFAQEAKLARSSSDEIFFNYYKSVILIILRTELRESRQGEVTILLQQKSLNPNCPDLQNHICIQWYPGNIVIRMGGNTFWNNRNKLHAVIFIVRKPEIQHKQFLIFWPWGWRKDIYSCTHLTFTQEPVLNRIKLTEVSSILFCSKSNVIINNLNNKKNVLLALTLRANFKQLKGFYWGKYLLHKKYKSAINIFFPIISL